MPGLLHFARMIFVQHGFARMNGILDEGASMADPANDFIRDYQTLAQQSWDTWTRQLQQQQPVASPFFAPPPASGNDTLERTLSGLKGYFDWMQSAASGGAATPSGDWRQQLQQMFGGAGSQPFSQAFGGIDSNGAEGFTRQWQSWMQAAQHGGFGDMHVAHGPTPAFGQNREQQMQQQAMATAVMESLQAAARYQSLIQRANAKGVERMQDKLAEHAEPGRQIDSLKTLYDLWVDAAEEAYAEIALSDEFRDSYGEMVNTQMRVRQMQQQQTEQMCQQLGVPTRSEVSSLGERLQALRREVVALKRQLASAPSRTSATKSAAPAARRPAAATKSAVSVAAVKKTARKMPAVKKAATKKAVKKAAPAKSRASTAAKSRPSPRKRT
jgi:polyhydroxyalkanoate synthesis regulator phasin